jgi:hypothetical protein
MIIEPNQSGPMLNAGNTDIRVETKIMKKERSIYLNILTPFLTASDETKIRNKDNTRFTPSMSNRSYDIFIDSLRANNSFPL